MKKRSIILVCAVTFGVGLGVLGFVSVSLSGEKTIQAVENNEQGAEVTKEEVEDVKPSQQSSIVNGKKYVSLEEVTVEKSEFTGPEGFVLDMYSDFEAIVSEDEMNMDTADHMARAVVVYTKYFNDEGETNEFVEGYFKDLREAALDIVNEQSEDAVVKVHDDLKMLVEYYEEQK